MHFAMAGPFDISPSDWTTLLLFLFVFLAVFVALRKPAGLPPGPPMLVPGLGHLLSFIGTDPLPVFARWNQEYGDVYSFFLGTRLVIVLSGYTTMKEALVFQGSKFSDRPNDPLINDRIKGNAGIIFASGDTWKQERKFIAQALQQLHFGRPAFEKTVHKELDSLVVLLESFSGTPTDIRGILLYSVSNLIKVIISGERAEYNDPGLTRFLQVQDMFTNKMATVSVALGSFPFLKYLPGDLFHLKGIMDANDDALGYIRDLHDSHVKTFDRSNPRDLMDYFIKEQKDKETAIHSYSDLFGAGSETTSSTLLWILLYLLHYPDVEKKCREQIHSVIGKHRFPTMEDKPNLPYVFATILEGIRIATVAMMSIPHAPPHDTTFRGYRIPKGTSVLLNMQSIFHDPTLFPEPSRFRPDRFLNETGEVEFPEYFIPFGIGRRICLGEAAAKMEVFLILTSLLQRFELRPEGDTLPTLKGKFSISYAPQQYKLRLLKCV